MTRARPDQIETRASQSRLVIGRLSVENVYSSTVAPAIDAFASALDWIAAQVGALKRDASAFAGRRGRLARPPAVPGTQRTARPPARAAQGPLWDAGVSTPSTTGAVGSGRV